MAVPDPNSLHPIDGIARTVFLKNLVSRPQAGFSTFPFAAFGGDWPIEQITRHIPEICDGGVSALQTAMRDAD